MPGALPAERVGKSREQNRRASHGGQAVQELREIFSFGRFGSGTRRLGTHPDSGIFKEAGPARKSDSFGLGPGNDFHTAEEIRERRESANLSFELPGYKEVGGIQNPAGRDFF